MANRAVLGCVDDVCRRVMRKPDVPFGGKVIVLLGDFRQTCPVIQHGTRAQIVSASIRSSPLWTYFNIRQLTVPIRNAEDIPYANMVDAIGDGSGPEVEIPLLLHAEDRLHLINFVFPPDVLPDPIQCLTRSILAPTNAQVDAYNNDIINSLPGQDRTYLAADSLQERDDALQSNLNTDDDLLPSPTAILDYVSHRCPPGMPHHRLNIKVGALYRIMRNLSIDRGLVKNARVMVTGLGQRLITIRIIRATPTGSIVDNDDILLPRITFKEHLSSGHTLLRRQFPLALAYATTFHSCQGLTLDKIGVDLTNPVFTHGQLYTALSRIRNRNSGCVLLPPNQQLTTNVTYNEILL